MGCFAWMKGRNPKLARTAGKGASEAGRESQSSIKARERVRSASAYSRESTILASDTIEAGQEKPVQSSLLRSGGDLDVIIVGAGLSGLIVADELTRAGLRVKILEAQDRVGGRTLDYHSSDGTVVEMGGQWIGPGQTEILALCNELGLETHNTYDQGESLYRSTTGAVKRYKEKIPCGLLASLDLLYAIRKLNSLSKGIPATEPGRAEQARWLDERSIGTWIDDNLKTAEGKALVRTAIKAVYAENAELISLLDLLATVAGAGGKIEQVLSDAQTTRIIQGPQAISKRLAARLPPGSLVLDRKVLSIGELRKGLGASGATLSSGFEVQCASEECFAAPVVVLTPPRPLLCQINFEPRLPTEMLQYYRRQPMGSVIKYNVIYPSPFWRKEGLTGAMINADESSPVQMTYDNSPAGSGRGVIVAFVLGNNSRQFMKQYTEVEERKQVVLQLLVRLFGRQAAHADEFHEKNWTEDPFATGGYGSFNPPGVLTSFGEEKSGVSRVGNLLFAGDATSEVWQGYMEGALRSGKVVAKEILACYE